MEIFSLLWYTYKASLDRAIGFYYEMPIDENSYSFVDFDMGISGHFSYSRELTEQEYENWDHGGKILDVNGEEVNINASFFSTFDGVFVVELPEYMPKGDYVYLLYQFINDEYCEVRILFSVNWGKYCAVWSTLFCNGQPVETMRSDLVACVVLLFLYVLFLERAQRMHSTICAVWSEHML